MDKKNKKDLNSFKGWLIVFLLMHAPIALYNITGGLTLVGTFISYKVSFWFVLLSAMLSFLLPAAIILLLKRKPIFRWVYVIYAIMMSINFLLNQGITTISIFVTLLCTAPWIIYIFKSERVKSVLANKNPTP